MNGQKKNDDLEIDLKSSEDLDKPSGFQNMFKVEKSSQHNLVAAGSFKSNDQASDIAFNPKRDIADPENKNGIDNEELKEKSDEL